MCSVQVVGACVGNQPHPRSREATCRKRYSSNECQPIICDFGDFVEIVDMYIFRIVPFVPFVFNVYLAYTTYAYS